jgi:hypothetical protein
MRHDKLRMTLVLAALVGALIAALVVSLPSLAASRHHSVKRSSTRGLRGPRGYRGRTGPAGPSGPAGPESPAGALTVPVTINWFGGANAAGYGVASPVTIAGIGTLTAECDYSAQQLVLTPASSAGTRTVADVTTLQGEGTAGVSSNELLDSYGASTPIVIPVPVNGMLTGTFSVEPDYGAGGAGPSPPSFIFSSERILNNPTSTSDYCSVAGQITEDGS